MVSSAWLAERLAEPRGGPSVQVIDGSWFLPDWPRRAPDEYAAAHIPGAIFFDIDVVADGGSGLPHTLPAPAAFEAHMRTLGLDGGSQVIVYDQTGVSTAARVWWMLRVMGHEDVALLDGGLPRWRAEGRPIEARAAPSLGRIHSASFSSRPNAALLRDLDAVRRTLAVGDAQVVDARSAARFAGEVEEPRPGLARGHIPGALSLPFTSLVDADGALLPAAELERAFRAGGVDPERPLIATCGSGVTACVIALAQARLGRWDAAVYDGSWAEWGARGELPVATGAAGA